MKARDQDKEENQSNGEVPLPAVSANTLARCLGVTPKIVYDLTKEGVIERGSGRLFQLEILRAPSSANGRIALILFDPFHEIFRQGRALKAPEAARPALNSVELIVGV